MEKLKRLKKYFFAVFSDKQTQTNKQTNRQSNEQTNRQSNKQTNKQTNKLKQRICFDHLKWFGTET